MNSLRKIWIPLLLVLVIWSLPQSVSARHIIGGEITYECLGIDTLNNAVTFRFEVHVYRDCAGGGANFDPGFEFGIYYKEGASWRLYDAHNTPLGSVQRINTNTDNPCVIIPPNVCVEEGIYEFTRTLPIRATSYMIAYQRCCRNNTITNIWDPGDQGAAYTIEITPAAQQSCNNSPTFKQFPPIVICVDEELNFDHGATDTEGDNLVYEFCTPLISGGQLGTAGSGPCPQPAGCNCVIPSPGQCFPPFNQVTYRAPLYTSTRPLGGDPVVSLDRLTGQITGIPREQGQFVVGVCVSEYRNGQLLSVVRRDFQFNVTYCEPTVFAQLESDDVIDGREFIINSCGENTVEFINESYSEQYIDSYLWKFDINGQIDSFDTRNVTVTFPGEGQYTGSMILNRGTECSDTAEVTVNVYPDINADYNFEYDTCIAGPVSFEDESESGSGQITDWMWDFGDGNRSSNPDPDHRFLTPGIKNVTLTVEDINECEAVMEKQITYFPVPPLIVVEPSTFLGCTPAAIRFENLSVPIDETYEINWDFGDGGGADEISPAHIYDEPGLYTVRVEITSPIGCYTEAEFPNWIKVEPSPDAAFTCSPEELNSFNKTVTFTDQSTGAASWQWRFSDDAISFDQNPVYTFQDTGRQVVELIVTHPSGCPDTAIKILDIVPVVTLHMPNAFTPNGDGDNDVFKGVGVFEGLSNYSMSIWNRWGERMFYSEDPTEGWDGTIDNSGAQAVMGVYVYQIEYIGPRGNRETLKGYATLVR
ncbi:MAG: PKD domain-containing protein [Saprospiraceae bacterium]|nr:PKD domain-containing protein [Saprospiraceae bacterium]